MKAKLSPLQSLIRDARDYNRRLVHMLRRGRPDMAAEYRWNRERVMRDARAMAAA